MIQLREDNHGCKNTSTFEAVHFHGLLFRKMKKVSIHYHSCHAYEHYKSFAIVLTPELIITHCFTTSQLLAQRHTPEGNVKLGFSSKRVNNYIFPFAEGKRRKENIYRTMSKLFSEQADPGNFFGVNDIQELSMDI